MYPLSWIDSNLLGSTRLNLSLTWRPGFPLPPLICTGGLSFSTLAVYAVTTEFPCSFVRRFLVTWPSSATIFAGEGALGAGLSVTIFVSESESEADEESDEDPELEEEATAFLAALIVSVAFVVAFLVSGSSSEDESELEELERSFLVADSFFWAITVAFVFIFVSASESESELSDEEESDAVFWVVLEATLLIFLVAGFFVA